MTRRSLWLRQVSWDAMNAGLPPIDANRVLRLACYDIGRALGLITR